MFRQIWLLLKVSSFVFLLAGCESAEVVVSSLSKKLSTLQVKSSLKAGIANSSNFLVEGVCLDSSAELSIEIRQGASVVINPSVPCSGTVFSTNFSLLALSDGPADLLLISNVGTVLQEQILIDRAPPVLSFSGASFYNVNTQLSPIMLINANEPIASFYSNLITVKAGGADVANCNFTPTVYPSAANPLLTIPIQISGCTISGTFDLEFAAGAAGDLVDNLSGVLVGAGALNIDLVEPSLTFSALPSFVNGDFAVSVTASEVMDWSTFDPSQLIFSNATFVSKTDISSTQISITVRPSVSGIVSVAASNGLAEDLLGNPSLAQAAVSTEFDDTAPTLNLISSALNAGSFLISAAASEPITGLTAADFSCTFCTVSSVASGPGLSYTITVSPTSENTLTLSFTSGAFLDQAANVNTVGNTLSWVYDVSPPNVTLSLLSSSLSKDFFDFRVVFNESVSGFDPAVDLSSWSGTFSNINIVSDTTYEFRFVPTNQGSQTVFVPGMAAVDSYANSSQPSNSILINFDKDHPFIVSVTPVSGNFITWTKTTSFEIDVVFSEDINALTLADLDLTLTDSVALSGGISALSPSHYRFTLQDPMNNAEGIQRFKIVVGNIVDLAGNSLAADSPVYEVWLDNRAPIVTGLMINPATVIGNTILPSFSWSAIQDFGAGVSVSDIRAGSNYGGSEYLSRTPVGSTGTMNYGLSGVALGSIVYPQLVLEDSAGNLTTLDLQTYQYLPEISLNGIFPSRLIVNKQMQVRIEGDNFFQGSLNVQVGSASCTNIQVISPKILYCEVTMTSTGAGFPVRAQRTEGGLVSGGIVSVASSDPCFGAAEFELCPGDNRLRNLGVIDPDGGGILPARRYVVEDICDVLAANVLSPACDSGYFASKDGVERKWDSMTAFDLSNVPNYNNTYVEEIFGSFLTSLILGNGSTRFGAAHHCRIKTFADLNDWYLPTATEFLAIAARLNSGSKIDQVGFSSINPYWTSSEENATRAWTVKLNFDGSLVSDPTSSNKIDIAQVRCVRSY